MSSKINILLLSGCLLSSLVFTLARTTNGQYYDSISNRRISGATNLEDSESFDQNETSFYENDTTKLENPLHSGTTNDYSWWNDFSLFYKVYKQCSKEDLTICLKIKLLTGLEKASRNLKEFSLIGGVKFLRDENNRVNIEPTLNENEIISNLPRSLEARDETLNSMIFSRILSFIRSHTLQIKFDDNDVAEDRSSEARRKKKGQGALIMIPLLLGGTMVPIAYGALAMLAGKALIVSKLALVLASIIGIKKLLSGGGGGHKESELVVSGGHSSSGWGREFDLAYSAYAPKDSKKTFQ